MFNKQKSKQARAQRRHQRVRAKVSGTTERPRASVSRSLKHLYVQIIDDSTGRTLVAAADTEIKVAGKPVEKAKAVGVLLAEKAQKAGITTVSFDRGDAQYHGRVQAVAEGLREGGLVL
jgi:large subunit ribosomal protein L18